MSLAGFCLKKESWPPTNPRSPYTLRLRARLLRFLLLDLVGAAHDSLGHLRPGKLDLRTQRFRDRCRVPFAPRHPAYVRWVTSHFLRHAIVDPPAQRG